MGGVRPIRVFLRFFFFKFDKTPKSNLQKLIFEWWSIPFFGLDNHVAIYNCYFIWYEAIS